MNIDRLDLIAYGHLTDVSLDLSATPHRFHLIVGANESGKSTSMRAISAWLFGFPHSTADDFQYPANKLRVGGVLRDGDTTLQCIRRKGRKSTLRAADDSTAVDESQWKRVLGNLDQPTFETQHALSHDELHRGGSQILQGQGELGELLFAAGAGLGRLRKVQEQLRDDYESLFKTRGKSAVGDALKSLKEMRDALKTAQVQPLHYQRLHSELDKQAELIEKLKTDLKQISNRRAAAAAALEALPIIPQWRSATAELDQLQDAPLLSEDFVARRRDWSAEQAVAESTLQRLQQQRSQLQDQLQAIGDDVKIRNHKVELESLLRELPVREQAAAEVTGALRTTLDKLQRDLRLALQDLAVDAITGQHASAGKVCEQSDVDSDADLGHQVDRLRLSETQRNRIGRLASSYEKLLGSQDEARRQVSKLIGRIEQAEQDVAALEVIDDSDAVGRLLDEIEPPSRLVQQVQESQGEVERWQQRCQTIQKRLAMDGDPQQIAELELPDPAAVQQAAAAISQAEEECRAARRRVNETRRQLDDLAAQHDAVQTQIKLPTLQELELARRHRDQAIQRFGQSLLVPASGDADNLPDEDLPTVDELVTLIRRADEIVDQLRAHHAEVHGRAAAAADLQARQRQLQNQHSELQQWETQLETARQNWQLLWVAIGVTARSPDAMVGWCAEHEKLVDTVERLDVARAAEQRALAKIELANARLRTVLASDDAADANDAGGDPIDDCLRLHDRAANRWHRHQQLQKQRDSLTQQLAAWRGELPEAQSALQGCEAALVQWQQQWDEATAALQTASPTPADALPLLDAIKDLVTLKKHRDETRHRIDEIRSQTAVYLRSAQRLIASIDDESVDLPSDQDPTQLLQRIAPRLIALGQRSKQESIDADARQRLQDQLAKLEQEWTAANECQQRLAVTRDELCREAGCDDPDDLPTIETRSQRRRDAMQRVRQAEADLNRLSGGSSLSQFVDPIQDLQPGVLQDQLAAAEEEKNGQTTLLEEAQREFGRLQQQLSAIDGRSSASDLAQSIQSQLGQIGRDAENYIRAKLAWSILRRAMEHYRNENQEPILKIAESYFRILTCGRYQGLKVDYDDKDTPLLHGVLAGGDGDVPAGAMSAGTADALYLSLRLASLKHQCEQGKPIPLIVDDCLIQLDDGRAAAAMKVFAELSKTTQVILFTHHPHLVDLAAGQLDAGQYHVHQLAAR